jgi:hypothetical protein
VVEFFPDSEHCWIGNFQKGVMGVDGMFELERSLLVIANGSGYLIEPLSGKCYFELKTDIQHVLSLEPSGLLISNGIWIDRLDATELVWRTQRISWDEMRSLHVVGDKLIGEASEPTAQGDEWKQFSVDLETGAVSDGTYTGPMDDWPGYGTSKKSA